MTWDIKWEVETYIGDGFYQCEFKIPLNSLKFPDGSKDWRFQVFRADIFTGEFSLWNKVPINQQAFDLAFFGNLIALFGQAIIGALTASTDVQVDHVQNQGLKYF